MIQIEAKLVEFFSNLEPEVTAYVSVPNPRPERFYTVERTGGASDRFIDWPQIAVQAWAGSRSQAAVMASRARMAALKLRKEPWCASVVLGGLYDFPDPDSRQARYQFTLEIGVMSNE